MFRWVPRVGTHNKKKHRSKANKRAPKSGQKTRRRCAFSCCCCNQCQRLSISRYLYIYLLYLKADENRSLRQGPERSENVRVLFGHRHVTSHTGGGGHVQRHRRACSPPVAADLAKQTASPYTRTPMIRTTEPHTRTHQNQKRGPMNQNQQHTKRNQVMAARAHLCTGYHSFAAVDGRFHIYIYIPGRYEKKTISLGHGVIDGDMRMEHPTCMHK